MKGQDCLSAHDLRPTATMTVEEYLELEMTSPVKHEYIGGYLRPVGGGTGESEWHNLIVANLVMVLGPAAVRSGSRVYPGAMMLQVDPNLIYFPDFMIVSDLDDRGRFVKHRPSLIVEVVSQMTTEVDLREKVAAYQLIDSLSTYLLVHEQVRRVIMYRRDRAQRWSNDEFVQQGIIPVQSPAFDLTLDEIYNGVVD